MPASEESASSSGGTASVYRAPSFIPRRGTAPGLPRAGEPVLICGVNWIGDTVMSMPAIQAYRRAHPTAHITLLVKPQLVPLWQLHRVPDRILTLHTGYVGTLRTIRALRRERFAKAFVLPHSLRSAFLPWAGGVPNRVGLPGHWRAILLSRVVRPREHPGRLHQAYEYIDLMVPAAAEKELLLPRLEFPAGVLDAALSRLKDVAQPRVGFLPGAARGTSKQWPAEHFIDLGRLLAGKNGCGIVVLGISSEVELCNRVTQGIGSAALNLAGRTTLAEWTAMLKTCDLVVANDSGGMHLAAAVGTPVIALYGMTDPARTGPLGRHCRVLQNSDVRMRDIPRHSEEARRCLASIRPEQVHATAAEVLKTAAQGKADA